MKITFNYSLLPMTLKGRNDLKARSDFNDCKFILL